MLQITNTMTGKKEIFTPIDPGKVLLYVCGITPYDFAHVGHGRVYVSFDVLYRLLMLLKYEVKYCRNFTDIDDKLINKAHKECGDGMRYADIATKFIHAYHEDMQKLNCLKPAYEPRVTETIPDIITFIKNLIAAGKAYEVDGDVYFSIPSFPAYGRLSKHNVDDLHAGARVEINEKKSNPLDFALWKKEEAHTFWQSPWGWGRPGWAIECSAMAVKYLGQHIDIHAGGQDLIFPHHENEIAQSEALYGHPFARYWMHNGFVTVSQEKMSKSLGNFFTLRQLFEQFDPMIVRYYILSHHYRAPMEFSFDDMKSLEKSYKKLCKFFETVQVGVYAADDVVTSAIVRKMLAFVSDDLNTPGMFGVLFESLDELKASTAEAVRVKAFMQQVMGLSLAVLPEKEVLITPEIEHLVSEREAARLAKDWKRADALRLQLQELGFDVQDKKVT